MNLKKHNITNMQKSAAHRRLVQSLAPHGASLVLTGEPGCGKSHLAQQAAHAFATQSQQPIHQVLIQQLDELLRLCLISPETPASDASDRVLASLQAEFPEHELVIVALGIDNYHGDEAAFFEHLVRARHVRFIGTAQQVVGAADRLARDPGGNLLAVEPFTIDESDAFLSRILGVDRFARQALENWYEATHGNPHAIATLAIAADRRGAIHRARRMGWITPREDRPPADFVAQLDELSPLEQDTLELVAFAEPLHEAALLQLLDTETVTKLLNKQVLVVRTDASGVTAIVTRLPILAAAIREHLSPKERNSGCSTPTCSPTRAPTPSGLETRTCPWSNSKCSTSSHTKPLVMTRFCSPGQRSLHHWSTSRWARRSSPIFDHSCEQEAATQMRTNAYSLNSAFGCRCPRSRSSPAASAKSPYSRRSAIRRGTSPSACSFRRERSKRTSRMSTRNSVSTGAKSCATGSRASESTFLDVQPAHSKLSETENMNTQHKGPRILIVDDEPSIRELLSTSLRFAGFGVRAVGNGAQTISAVLEEEPDLIILDVMLPDMNGFSVTKRLRSHGFTAPILFLTAKDDTEDKVMGLTVGGDDYVTKPFSLDEIIARIKAILRRTIQEDEEAVLETGPIVLDQDTHEVRVAGSPIELSPTEFKLLRYLMQNANRVLSKAQILDHVWEYDFNGDAGIVESYISYLRRKLDPLTGESLIQTKRGFGYMLKTDAK